MCLTHTSDLLIMFSAGFVGPYSSPRGVFYSETLSPWRQLDKAGVVLVFVCSFFILVPHTSNENTSFVFRVSVVPFLCPEANRLWSIHRSVVKLDFVMQPGLKNTWYTTYWWGALHGQCLSCSFRQQTTWKSFLNKRSIDSKNSPRCIYY